MVDEKIILQVLSEQQEEIKNYKLQKWVARKEESLFEFDSSQAQVVIGVRRSGKSTLCHKVLKERGVRYAYVNLDDDRLVNVQTEDLNTVLSCVYQLYGTDIPYLFLDEIQDVDGWYLFVNRLLRTDLHIFVTGSNAKLLSGELATHLTGRYNEIRLYPFSFAEYCSFHKVDINGLTTKADAERKAAFMDYINNGGFPEMQNMRNKRGYVESLIEAVLLKDIQRRFKIRNVESLRKIAHHLISNSCQIVNYEGMVGTFGLTDKTLQKYVSYLQQAFLVQLLTKHSFKSKERVRGSKAYVIDSGLLNNRGNSMAAENIGWRLENVVYIELLRRCANEFMDVYYYKPRASKKEVDFVVCDKNKAYQLIQVAYDIAAEKTYKREISSLVAASSVLNGDNLLLIALAESRDVEFAGKTIHIKSIYDWLLNPESSLIQ
ncbi:MAG: ATP-binding protein [Muribaculaceae bacterium]|nr:ATP-binding protein [Muribaculaceae bacterium]